MASFYSCYRSFAASIRLCLLSLLAEYADEGTPAEIIAAGACDFVKKSELCEEYLGRSIRYAVNLHRKDQKRQQAEEMLRKLFQAVEQSADLVMITDQVGLIEYVNPAFETLTGYASEEVGRQHRCFIEVGGTSAGNLRRTMGHSSVRQSLSRNSC